MDSNTFSMMKIPAEPSPVPPVGSDDEESFVVLETSSFCEDDIDDPAVEETLPPIRNNTVHEIQNQINMEISQISNPDVIFDIPVAATPLNGAISSVTSNTLSPESSYEEVQKHVEELIKENEKLKNIIAQNNLSMKTQYDRILAWKEEVNKVWNSYKTKIIEAKNCIDKCKEENAKLAIDVEKYKKIKELQDEEIMNLKGKEKDNDVVGTLSSTTEYDLKKLDLQIDDLKVRLAESNLKNVEISKENEKLTEKLNAIPKVEDELQKKQEENETLKMDIATLRNREKVLCDQIGIMKKEMCELQAGNEKILKENQVLKEASNIWEDQLNAKEIKIMELQRKLNLAHEKIECSSSEEILTLKKKLQSLQDTRDPGLEEEYEHIRQQLMNSQITITALEQEIKDKAREIEEVRKLLQASSKSDEIFALKEQLIQYKNDFDAERKAKDSLKQERLQLAEDLQNLQRRNEQLQQEIESWRIKKSNEGFICPKCAFGFSTYQSLENHVHRCLDLDGFP